MDTIILAILFLAIIIMFTNKTEGFMGMHSSPVTILQPPFYRSWCTDSFGRVIPCPSSCNYSDNPACGYAWPVPRTGFSASMDSPTGWCPGSPVC